MSAPKTATTAHGPRGGSCRLFTYTLLSIKFVSVSSRLAVKEIRQFKETINKEALTVTNIQIHRTLCAYQNI